MTQLPKTSSAASPKPNELEELRLIQSAISDAVLIVDHQLAPTFFNSRLKLMFEVDHIEHSLKDPLNFIPNPEVIEAFKEVLQTGKPQSLTALKFHLKNGGRLYISVSISPIKVSEIISGVIGIFHDVTELKTAEQMRIDFVANVSHELRTPLTSIQGYIETLIGDAHDGRAIDTSYLQVVQRNTERLITLIDDLLDLSTLESNPAALHKEKVDTLQISARILSNLLQKTTSKNHAISVDASKAPIVYADPRRLEQVITNLLDNAIKYTPPEGKIRVLWEESPDSPGALLKISDTGPGIPAKLHSRLFERFFRVDKARSRDMGGTGLGLAIVKHIMQSHQGSVEVDSVPGIGTTFICTFPHPKNIPGLGTAH